MVGVLYFVSFMIKRLLLVFWGLGGAGNAQIYADFQTSMGEFTCELNYEKSPQAVANFMGLADGTRPWIDPATGAVRMGVPYYSGVKFHRVIDGFMNQSGSRNGLGTDGPGYSFRDEVTNGLTHSKAGMLSMANSGVNTNGAQFFITVEATSFLDGGYTIFGEVTAGLEVVMAINGVPKTSNSSGELSVPVTPVIIQNITIRRVGTAANAFDIQAQKLPICGRVEGALRVTPGVKVDYVMAATQPAATIVQAFRSADLISWSLLKENYQGTGGTGGSGAPELTMESAPLAPKAFYNVSLVHYPDALGPASTANRTLTATFGTDSLTYHFNAQGTGGSFDYHHAGTVTSHTIERMWFEPNPWTATWVIVSPGFASIRISGALDSSTSSLIQGRMSLATWNGLFWNSPTTGTMSLTK